jgi:putative hydrolase of the HAD superfamily
MKPSHVFFDFAGTLVEGVPTWEWPQIAACAEVGVSVTPAEVKSAIWKVWLPLEGCVHVDESAEERSYEAWIDAIEARILRGLGVSDEDLPTAVRRVTDLQIDPATYRLYSDSLPALQELRCRGVKIGIVSNFAWHLPRLVDMLEIDYLVDDVVTSARVGYRKPRPEIFRLAVDRIGATVSTSVFVGDDPECDLAGARRAGLHAILVDRDRRFPDERRRVESLFDVSDYLD